MGGAGPFLRMGMLVVVGITFVVRDSYAIALFLTERSVEGNSMGLILEARRSLSLGL